MAPVLPRPLSLDDLEGLRFAGERPAAERLRKVPGFAREARERRLDRLVRDDLTENLTHELRLERSVAPELFAILDEVRAALPVERRVEVFQFSGSVNASVTSCGEVVLLGVEGCFLEVFDPDETRGVFGHEFTHHLLHADHPAFADVNAVALEWITSAGVGEDRRKLYLASEYGIAHELTADRVELLLAGSLEVYLRAALKFATESRDTPLLRDPALLLAQAREALARSSGAVEREGSHPHRALRLRAAELFTTSDVYARLSGRPNAQRPLADVDAEISSLLAGWVPRRADRVDPADLDRFLLAASLRVARVGDRLPAEARSYLTAALRGAMPSRLPTRAEADATVASVAAAVRAADDERARLVSLHLLCALVESDGFVRPRKLAAVYAVGSLLGARELFRVELDRRYDWSPSDTRTESSNARDAAIAACPESLERYLDTVVHKGRRTIPLQRLLGLAARPRWNPAARKFLQAQLDAADLAATPALEACEPSTKVTLRAR